jgi:uncharacterized protein DUF6600
MPLSRRTLTLILGSVLCLATCAVARAQETAGAPAYLAVVEGAATIDRDGDVQPAVRDMPFVTGDRLRTEAGRVEIDFPDGTAIEVGADSEIEALSPTRVRLLSGTMDRVPRSVVQTDSAAYLPQDLQRYGQTFDQNGSWNYDASYGYVWYPRVAADWRPYYYGSWSSVPSYGWTWIGLDPWSWPTHHYGRWGYARNSWFWIPGRSWSAAWVSWGLATDYVSWCPLGFDGRPVFALAVGFGGHGWNGWTVMSRNHFGYRGYYAHRDSVDTRIFDRRTRFVQTARLPRDFGRAGAHDRGRAGVDPRGSAAERRGRQAPRSTVVAPGASPGAVPRGTSRDYRPPPPDPRRTTTDPRPIPPAERRPATAAPRPSNVDPRPSTVDPRTPNVDRRTPNVYRPAVPGAVPRVRETAPNNRPPAPEYRAAPPEPRRPPRESRSPTVEPERARAHERAAPAPRQAQPEHAAPVQRAAPRERAAPPPRAAAPERAAPRGEAGASKKGESAGTRRPR